MRIAGCASVVGFQFYRQPRRARARRRPHLALAFVPWGVTTLTSVPPLLFSTCLAILIPAGRPHAPSRLRSPAWTEEKPQVRVRGLIIRQSSISAVLLGFGTEAPWCPTARTRNLPIEGKHMKISKFLLAYHMPTRRRLGSGTLFALPISGKPILVLTVTNCNFNKRCLRRWILPNLRQVIGAEGFSSFTHLGG